MARFSGGHGIRGAGIVFFIQYCNRDIYNINKLFTENVMYKPTVHKTIDLTCDKIDKCNVSSICNITDGKVKNFDPATRFQYEIILSA